MAPGAAAQFDTAALQARQALQGKAGPMALVTNAKVFGIACFACLGGLFYGYNQGVFSGVLAMHNFNDRTSIIEIERMRTIIDKLFTDMGVWTKNQTNKGWLTSILELGAWIGTLYSGFLAEIFSRKYAILMNTVVFVIGVVIQATAVTSAGHSSILAGRFITGMGVGSLSMIVPMYNAECAPPEVRGALVGLQQLAITTGIMISFWIDYGTNFIGGTGDGQTEAAWLVPLCLQLFPALLLGGGILFMPFSPRWLEHHGREAEARKTLASLRGLSQDHELIELEYAEIKAQSLFEKRTVAEHFPHLADGSSMSVIKLQFVAVASLFKSKPMLRRVALATITMFFQQWTGINAILYYAPQIFQGLGLSGTTISLPGHRRRRHRDVDRHFSGRHVRGQARPQADPGVRRHRHGLLPSHRRRPHGLLPARLARARWRWLGCRRVFVWIFVIFFGYSWGPCAWIIIAEIWPISQRPYGIALGASSNWVSASRKNHERTTC